MEDQIKDLESKVLPSDALVTEKMDHVLSRLQKVEDELESVESRVSNTAEAQTTSPDEIGVDAKNVEKLVEHIVQNHMTTESPVKLQFSAIESRLDSLTDEWAGRAENLQETLNQLKTEIHSSPKQQPSSSATPPQVATPVLDNMSLVEEALRSFDVTTVAPVQKQVDENCLRIQNITDSLVRLQTDLWSTVKDSKTSFSPYRKLSECSDVEAYIDEAVEKSTLGKVARIDFAAAANGGQIVYSAR